MDRYKRNLKLDNNKVYSYGTHVATIHDGVLWVHKYWSKTTTKHVNYIAQEHNLQVRNSDPIPEN
jgi:hypothetical protein